MKFYMTFQILSTQPQHEYARKPAHRLLRTVLVKRSEVGRSVLHRSSGLRLGLQCTMYSMSQSYRLSSRWKLLLLVRPTTSLVPSPTIKAKDRLQYPATKRSLALIVGLGTRLAHDSIIGQIHIVMLVHWKKATRVSSDAALSYI